MTGNQYNGRKTERRLHNFSKKIIKTDRLLDMVEVYHIKKRFMVMLEGQAIRY